MKCIQNYLFHSLTNSNSSIFFLQITLLIAFVTLVTAQYGYDDGEYREEVSVLNIIIYLPSYQ